MGWNEGAKYELLMPVSGGKCGDPGSDTDRQPHDQPQPGRKMNQLMLD